MLHVGVQPLPLSMVAPLAHVPDAGYAPLAGAAGTVHFDDSATSALANETPVSA